MFSCFYYPQKFASIWGKKEKNVWKNAKSEFWPKHPFNGWNIQQSTRRQVSVMWFAIKLPNQKLEERVSALKQHNSGTISHIRSKMPAELALSEMQ